LVDLIGSITMQDKCSGAVYTLSLSLKGIGKLRKQFPIVVASLMGQRGSPSTLHCQVSEATRMPMAAVLYAAHHVQEA
jgi:hypothetical protein